LCRPVETSHADGVRGQAGRRPLLERHRERVLERFSAMSMSPSRRMSVARIRPCSDRKISSMRASISGKATPPGTRAHAKPDYFSDPATLAARIRIGRTSIGEAGQRQGVPGDEVERLVEVLRLQDGVPRELLLGLGEGAIRHHRLALLDPTVVAV
jgi:hypothetical protein